MFLEMKMFIAVTCVLLLDFTRFDMRSYHLGVYAAITRSVPLTGLCFTDNKTTKGKNKIR